MHRTHQSERAPKVQPALTLNDTVEHHQRIEYHLRKAKMVAEEKLRNYSSYLALNDQDLKKSLTESIEYSKKFLNEQPIVNGQSDSNDYAHFILSTSQHLLNLISDLSDMSKLDAQSLKLCERSVTLHELVNHTTQTLQARIEKAGLKLEVCVAKDLSPIFLDFQRVTQAMLNILSNAIKFTTQGGRISITAFQNEQKDMEMHISDNGIGMRKAEIAKLFTEFGKARQGYEACTGLGLPLAKRLIELHGGSLEVTSQINIGTTITLIIPAQRWQNSLQ